MTRLRLGRIIQLPRINDGAIRYCPRCGQHATVQTDNNENYWESLASAYNVPVEAIVQLHSIWDRREYPNFRTFVEEVKRESLELVGKLVKS